MAAVADKSWQREFEITQNDPLAHSVGSNPARAISFSLAEGPLRNLQASTASPNDGRAECSPCGRA